MSSRIRADFGGFAAAEQGFQTIWQTLEATVDELDATLSAGLAEWTGDAKHAYQDFYDTWHTTARDVAARLDRLRNAVNVAHHNFTSAKTASLRMWTPR